MTDMPAQPNEPDVPAEDASEQPSEVERNWAMAAHIGSFAAAWVALGLIAPLIVMLTKGNDSAYVRRHAVESLNFQINALIWIAVSVVLFLVLIGFFVLLAYGLFYLIVVIRGGVAASRGEEFRYPLTIRFVS